MAEPLRYTILRTCDCRVMDKVATMKQAEAAIADIAVVDPAGIVAGDYAIDVPAEWIGPGDEMATPEPDIP